MALGSAGAALPSRLDPPSNDHWSPIRVACGVSYGVSQAGADQWSSDGSQAMASRLSESVLSALTSSA